MTKSNALLVTLFVGLALCILGCQTVIVGPGGETQAVYSMGNLKATEEKPIAVVNAAALKAMDDLGLTVTMKTADSLSGRIIARDSMDRKVDIYLTAISDNSTKVVIDVGAGNENKARLIYKQMQGDLKK